MPRSVRHSNLLERVRGRPLTYLITDRLLAAQISKGREMDALIDLINRAVYAGVDLLQIRERDLSTRQLFQLAEKSVAIARSGHTQILINDRADVAAAVGAGVHLTTHSMTVDVVRKAFGNDMLVACSTHTIEEAKAAEQGGADFIVFGPVFETESKKIYGPPVGLDELGRTISKLTMPVLALGGINLENFHKTIEAGAAGIAAISLFARANDLAKVVETIKSYGRH